MIYVLFFTKEMHFDFISKKHENFIFTIFIVFPTFSLIFFSFLFFFKIIFTFFKDLKKLKVIYIYIYKFFKTVQN